MLKDILTIAYSSEDEELTQCVNRAMTELRIIVLEGKIGELIAAGLLRYASTESQETMFFGDKIHGSHGGGPFQSTDAFVSSWMGQERGLPVKMINKARVDYDLMCRRLFLCENVSYCTVRGTLRVGMLGEEKAMYDSSFCSIFIFTKTLPEATKKIVIDGLIGLFRVMSKHYFLQIRFAETVVGRTTPNFTDALSKIGRLIANKPTKKTVATSAGLSKEEKCKLFRILTEANRRKMFKIKFLIIFNEVIAKKMSFSDSIAFVKRKYVATSKHSHFDELCSKSFKKQVEKRSHEQKRVSEQVEETFKTQIENLFKKLHERRCTEETEEGDIFARAVIMSDAVQGDKIRCASLKKELIELISQERPYGLTLKILNKLPYETVEILTSTRIRNLIAGERRNGFTWQIVINLTPEEAQQINGSNWRTFMQKVKRRIAGSLSSSHPHSTSSTVSSSSSSSLSSSSSSSTSSTLSSTMFTSAPQPPADTPPDNVETTQVPPPPPFPKQ